MQPRPCDCTPMCVLRATNPMKIRLARSGDPTFAAASVYRAAEPSSGDLSRRLSGYVVLAHDPAVPSVAADYWQHSAPFYRAAVAAAQALAGCDPAAWAAYQRLAARPTDPAAEQDLQARLAGLLPRHPGLAAAARRAADTADDNVYINYFRGEDYRPTAAPAGLDTLAGIARRRPRRPPAGTGDEILVVIPLMDRGGAGRIRNLAACLLALHDQTFPAGRYRITVVEFDQIPRWRAVIEPLADHYLHVRGDGPFNKSWSLNVGVRQTIGAARTLCLLDADILVDRHFLERNHARFADPGHGAHLPHTEVLSLDQASSDRAIGQRCGTGAAQAPLAGARGLLLRDAPGGCLWMRPEIFHRIGGLDERYRGWGGEDEDMLVRTTAAGATTQYDDVFIHLAHQRPAMRHHDGTPLNGHIPVGTWTGQAGYGDLAGPTLAAAR